MKMFIKVDKFEHGKEIPGGVGRYCKLHRVIHGRFYRCEAYPRETNESIRMQERQWLHASASYALVIIFVVLLVVTALQ